LFPSDWSVPTLTVALTFSWCLNVATIWYTSTPKNMWASVFLSVCWCTSRIAQSVLRILKVAFYKCVIF
jgi:hypothetical protein